VFLGATSIIIAVLMAALIPPFLDPGKGDETPVSQQPPETRVSYTLNSGDFPAIPNHKDETEYLPGAMSVYYGIDSLNGYSSLAYKGWDRVFGCKSVETPFCVIYVTMLLQHGRETGAPYIDLFKIDTVAAQKGLPALIATTALPRWTSREMSKTLRLSRPNPEPLPGTVSWHSAGLSLDGPAKLKANGEKLTVANGRNTPGLITFARLYFPGFRAFLDGRELTVRPVDGIVTGVEVPPHASGALRLTFLPPLLIPCALLAAGALLCWAAAAFLENRGRLRGL
jgi:hypothetical protein